MDWPSWIFNGGTETSQVSLKYLNLRFKDERKCLGWHFSISQVFVLVWTITLAKKASCLCSRWTGSDQTESDVDRSSELLQKQWHGPGVGVLGGRPASSGERDRERLLPSRVAGSPSLLCGRPLVLGERSDPVLWAVGCGLRHRWGGLQYDGEIRSHSDRRPALGQPSWNWHKQLHLHQVRERLTNGDSVKLKLPSFQVYITFTLLRLIHVVMDTNIYCVFYILFYYIFLH